MRASSKRGGKRLRNHEVKARYKARKSYARLNDKEAAFVGKELESLFSRVGRPLQAEDIVNAARSRRSPLHKYFEWDDSIAAERYRQVQARQLLHYFEIEIIETGQRAPAYVHLEVRGGAEDGLNGGYHAILDVMSDGQKRRILLAKALIELDAWKARYAALSELERIFAAIDRTRRTVALRPGRNGKRARVCSPRR